jgi:cytoskeletal protein RodZ
MLKQKTNSKKSKKIYLVIAVVTVVIIGGVVAFMVHRSSENKKPAPTASQLTKGEVTSGSSKSSGSSNSSSTSGLGSQTSDDKNDTGSQTGTTAKLIAPTGTFVSNHHPNLGGSPAPNEEQSTCNTTPGATCQISFTYNGITKTLPAQTADSGGATYWTWTLQDIGLTQGSWHIQATASLNGTTLTASDALTLEVQP